MWARNPTTRSSCLQTRWMPWFGGVGDLGERGGWQVGQLDVLEVGPQILDRVELGRVGGQSLCSEPVVLAVEVGPHPVAPVRAQPVPDQHHPLAGVEAPELVQDRDEGVGVVAGLLQVKAQPGRGAVGPIAQGGRHGGLLPPEAVAQDRGVAPWRPGAAHRWDQRDGRFVDKDDPGRFCGGPFLIRGHSWATQRAIASSSRSLARRSGPLQAPAQPAAQDHPDMAGVIADPGELGDHHRDPFQGPQVGVEPIGLGALPAGPARPWRAGRPTAWGPGRSGLGCARRPRRPG